MAAGEDGASDPEQTTLGTTPTPLSGLELPQDDDTANDVHQLVSDSRKRELLGSEMCRRSLGDQSVTDGTEGGVLTTNQASATLSRLLFFAPTFKTDFGERTPHVGVKYFDDSDPPQQVTVAPTDLPHHPAPLHPKLPYYEPASDPRPSDAAVDTDLLLGFPLPFGLPGRRSTFPSGR